jgi:hypothetical protein
MLLHQGTFRTLFGLMVKHLSKRCERHWPISGAEN